MKEENNNNLPRLVTFDLYSHPIIPVEILFRCVSLKTWITLYGLNKNNFTNRETSNKLLFNHPSWGNRNDITNWKKIFPNVEAIFEKLKLFNPFIKEKILKEKAFFFNCHLQLQSLENLLFTCKSYADSWNVVNYPKPFNELIDKLLTAFKNISFLNISVNYEEIWFLKKAPSTLQEIQSMKGTTRWVPIQKLYSFLKFFLNNGGDEWIDKKIINYEWLFKLYWAEEWYSTYASTCFTSFCNSPLKIEKKDDIAIFKIFAKKIEDKVDSCIQDKPECINMIQELDDLYKLIRDQALKNKPIVTSFPFWNRHISNQTFPGNLNNQLLQNNQNNQYIPPNNNDLNSDDEDNSSSDSMDFH